MSDSNSDGIPSAGTSTARDASDAMEKVSSGIYDLLGVKGKATENRPGVMECGDKDPDTYFRISHPWSFVPATTSDLDVAMANLKAELPKRGWKIVEYGPDTSKNKNVNLTADNDEKKVSVQAVALAKGDAPMLTLDLVSGCYKTPDGEEIPAF